MSGYQGKRLDVPNDVWVRPDGGLYFTDPDYVNTFGTTGAFQDSEAVYYLSPDHHTLVRVITDLVHPNGIIGTPDGKILYVGSTGWVEPMHMTSSRTECSPIRGCSAG